jgi:hypothetical protein
MTMIRQHGGGTGKFERFPSIGEHSITMFLCRWRNNSRHPTSCAGLITSTQIEAERKKKR